jgi:hypothetical protein
MKKVFCDNCAKSHHKESLRRSCGNCFLCAGCEIYKCPNCQEEIVVTPMRIAEYSQRAPGCEDSEIAD